MVLALQIPSRLIRLGSWGQRKHTVCHFIMRSLTHQGRPDSFWPWEARADGVLGGGPRSGSEHTLDLPLSARSCFLSPVCLSALICKSLHFSTAMNAECFCKCPAPPGTAKISGQLDRSQAAGTVSLRVCCFLSLPLWILALLPSLPLLCPLAIASLMWPVRGGPRWLLSEAFTAP